MKIFFLILGGLIILLLIKEITALYKAWKWADECSKKSNP